LRHRAHRATSTTVKLPSAKTAAFDEVYAAVTVRIKAEADKLHNPEKLWLQRLIKTFQDERTLWQGRPELDGYRQGWMRLRTRVLCLTAGMYLHISYDLPRAIANDWPGQGNWASGPDEIIGQGVYRGLRDVFADSFFAKAGRRSVTGAYAILMPLLSRTMGHWIKHWVLELRNTAWEHARVLARSDPVMRQNQEAAMAEAMTAALKDVSDWTPWSVAVLEPPERVFWTPIAASLAQVLILVSEYGSIVTLAAILALVVYQYRASLVQRSQIEMQFVKEFATLLDEYITEAIRSPSTFEDYRRDRQGRGSRQTPPSPLPG
jgi:hypothetical protein